MKLRGKNNRGKKRIKRNYFSSGDGSFWISYSDLVSALLLMFTLFLVVSVIDNRMEIENTKKQIEETVTVKSQIIEELIKAFKDSNLEMKVDPQTGAITFSGGVFFETGKSDVSTNGEKYLKEFFPNYIDILLSERFKNDISQIIVEGHTDDVGEYLDNLKLSQDRALSVVNVVYGENFSDFKNKEELKSIITANGRSYSIPVLNEKGKIDRDKSRRVEFKFRLKDDETIKKIQELVVE